MTEEQIHRHINDRPDSITIGTPSKGGEVKVYFNAASDVQEIKNLINQALSAREFMQGKIAEKEAKP